MTNINEAKFYEALENIFTGAKIEGDSGYINLLKIKSRYYNLILEQFKKEVDQTSIVNNDFKEEFFDRLYSFFEKYFSESGSVYFVKTANYQKVYEQVYTDNKDVMLFWKTNMLYYVKSDILFQSMAVEIADEQSANAYNFYFDVGELKNKQNNEKKDLLFTFSQKQERDGKKAIVFNISYSEQGRKTKISEISKDLKIKEEILEKAFAVFKKQSEVDFFINKNAHQFLNEQLDLYLHQILLDTQNQFDQTRLNQLKTIKEFAQKIISFIAQFEDELVRIWNKPKFALNSNYVITLDKLSDSIIKKISEHSNLKEQIKEWQELGMTEKDFKFFQKKEEHKYLPIDTKYFKDLELDILSLFDNLDEALDGRLIHSDNYQALNTLQEKYKEKVQCIYIDPPYNTNSSPIIYVNNYKDSSWLTAIHNRMDISKKLLKDDGINITAIDDIELRYLISLQDDIFGKENYITIITTECNPQGRVADKVSKTTEFHILHANNLNNIDKLFVKKNGDKKTTPLKRTGTNSRREERPNRYYPILIKEEKIFMITDEEYKNIYDRHNQIFDDDFVEQLKQKYEKAGFLFVLPIMENKQKLVWQRTFDRVKKEKDYYTVRGGTIYTPSYDVEIPKTLWKNPIFSNPEYGSEYLKHILGHSQFETPKSVHTIKQFLSMFEFTGIYLDYFGGSATTAEAVIAANREDDGDRKYIIIEMGEHINTVIIPRIKKIVFSDKWKEGKTLNGNGISHFFKYYSLEQYENALKKMKYGDDTPNGLWDNKNPFETYIFKADKKFVDVLSVNGETIDIDFDKLYPNIDFAETISCIRGLPIKKITKTGVLLDGENEERKTDYKNMTANEKIEFIKLLKPLLWWGK
ncbi:MAG: site-specific DNA-methyltransferase [Elusimicrobiota bacterium]|jgi:adenine-specific DNA-methyltransferase|nr:site-specific DNA-methyltransferase [Elusimicrobiota bacterium]